MGNIVSGIYFQKLSEIQARVPVKILQSKGTVSFSQVLSEKNNAIPSVSAAAVPAQQSVNGGGNYHNLVRETSNQYGISDALISAIISAESGFDPSALSSGGAMGLMQLMPATAAGLGVDNPFDPAQNVDGGVRYIKQMLERYNGNVKLALAAYNCGSGTLARLGIDNLDDPAQMAKLPSETRNYVQKIMAYLLAGA